METIESLAASPDAVAFLFQLLALWPLWRTFSRAGLRPYLALVVLIPLVGLVAALGVLAVLRWPAAAGGKVQQ